METQLQQMLSMLQNQALKQDQIVERLDLQEAQLQAAMAPRSKRVWKKTGSKKQDSEAESSQGSQHSVTEARDAALAAGSRHSEAGVQESKETDWLHRRWNRNYPLLSRAPISSSQQRQDQSQDDLWQQDR